MTESEAVDLVRAAQAGDDEALATLLSTQLSPVYNVIGRALHGHADVDDMVQETMVRVMRGLPGLREPDRFPAWVMAIAHRQVLMYQRSHRRNLPRREEISVDQPDPAGDFAERTVTELMLSGQRRELTEAAVWLDDADQRLLSLWWQETLGKVTRSELAAKLSISPKHAGVRLRRMTEQLEAVRIVVRALHASPRCPDLSTVVHGWNGVAAPVWRKRLVRHVRGCPRCGRYERGLVPPEKLLLGVVALPVAAGFAAEAPAAGTLSAAGSAVQSFFSNKMVAAAAAATVMAGGGFAYAVYETPAVRDDAPAIARPTVAAPAVVPGGGAAPTSAVPSPSAAGTGAAAMTGVETADIFVAPDGSDAGGGTVDRPYATLGRAVAQVRPGQTIAVRGGAYRPTAGVVLTISGEEQRRITVSNYRNERPVFDAGLLPDDESMVTHEADYWTVQGLEIKNSRGHAYVCRACRYNVLRRLSIHDNVRSSLTLKGAGTVGNQILDSDFFNNYDPSEGGRAGIGLGIKEGSGEGNVIRGSRAFDNADNGFDVGDFASPVTVENSWAYGNGVNRWNVAGWQSNGDGFHLGGGNPPPAAAHVLRHNAAWDNVGAGFASSGNRGALQVSNNTAFRNAGVGFFLPDAAGTLSGNASVDNVDGPATAGAGTASRGNTWEVGTAGAEMFRSTDPTAAQGPRSADGTLPRVDFLVGAGGVGAAMSRR